MSALDDGQGRYSAEAWEQTKRDALQGRAADTPRPVARSHSPATLAPGIVEMSLRGDDSDVEQILERLRGVGIKAWRANSTGTRDGNRAGYLYYSVEVPRDARG